MPSDVSHPLRAANDPAEAERLAGLRADVRRFVAERLAPAMVPSRFVVADQLPRLPNGKVDRRQLAADAASETPPSWGRCRMAPPTSSC